MFTQPRSRLSTVLALICIAGATLPAQEPAWLAVNRAARDAIRANDYAKLRIALVQAKTLMPGNPRNAYNLAASEAMLGNRGAALAALLNWADMGLTSDLAADTDFASLRDSPQYRAALAKVEANRRPVSGSKPAFAIPGRDILPEDIAWDPATRRFFLSSVRDSRILTGDGRPFASAEWSVLALRSDPKHRILWASTGWLPHCSACKEADRDKSALLAFDLDTGKLRQRVASPLPGLLGDMTLGKKGDIYVSEGIHGAVMHLKPGGTTLERLDIEGEFPSPQTPALSADEKILYVPDYVRGIAAIRLLDRHVEWLQPADGIALSGIGGLYVYGNAFYAVQNGTTPARIVRFSRDLKSMQVLEANTPGLGEPTHGVIVGNDFYFIANSGWGEYDDKGLKKTGTAPVESTVRKLKLKR